MESKQKKEVDPKSVIIENIKLAIDFIDLYDSTNGRLPANVENKIFYNELGYRIHSTELSSLISGEQAQTLNECHFTFKGKEYCIEYDRSGWFTINQIDNF